MSDQIFERIVVPVGNPDDAATTADALLPYVVGGGCTVVIVHVIEKADGALDKASVEQLEQFAEEIFSVVRDCFVDVDTDLDTQILYGTDIASTVIEAAHDLDASAIVFTPRGGNRWLKLLSGDVTHKLVETSDVPILVLPHQRGAKNNEQTTDQSNTDSSTI